MKKLTLSFSIIFLLVLSSCSQMQQTVKEAMNDMQSLMQSPDAMKNWFEQKRREFDALPEIES